MIKIKKIYIALLALSLNAGAQNYQPPLDIPLLLSGNFGELRSNHFHAGLDFKTQGVEGKPVYAVDSGYVSRITVGPWGYGNGLYITHTDGTMTVYGHLKDFIPELARYVEEQQYMQERFSVDLKLSPEQFPVSRGQLVAFSGNTGSSGGPHLHFEVRKNGIMLDPMPFFRKGIKDTRKPRIRSVLVCPIPGKGVVNGRSGKLVLTPVTSQNGQQVMTGKITAWGEIGLAIRGNDYMDGTENVYGIRNIVLEAEKDTIFQSDLGEYPLADSRSINSFVDYEVLKRDRAFYIKTYTDPGNDLPFFHAKNSGCVTIDEEKTYHLRCTLSDYFGNTTTLSVWIEGKRSDIPAEDTEGKEYFHWNSENKFGAKGVRLSIPRSGLYNSFYFSYDAERDTSALASVHHLHTNEIPLALPARLSIHLQHDTLENKRQYGIVSLQNGYRRWLGGSYRLGWIDTDIWELGTFTIATDTVPPRIIPLNQSVWAGNRMIRIQLSDNLSGVAEFRGEIDGQFALFKMNKSQVISYRFDSSRLTKGKHHLKLEVTDGCGNISSFEYDFTN